MLLSPAATEFVDHIDGDGLNNRRSNLRIADRSGNGANRGRPANNSCGFKGASAHGKRWIARVGYRGQVMRIGMYDTRDEAAAAYGEAATALHGQFARLA
jgi:hypothetical protein